MIQPLKKKVIKTMPSISHHDADLKIDKIRDILETLWVEISGQIYATAALLDHPSSSIFNKINSRDDYIDNLKTTIENECFSRIHGDEPLSKEEINKIRTIQIICVNLERIADFCVNIARQLEYFPEADFIHRFDYRSMTQEIEQTVSLIPSAFDNKNLSSALNICRSEYRLDQLFKKEFDRIMVELNKGKYAQDLVTALFIFRYLERIGDSLLNIGEALLFLLIGEKIKIHQFEALEKTLASAGFKVELSEIDFKSIWGSRSGCRISMIAQKTISEEKSQGVLKEGNLDKIRREKDNLTKWGSVYPGLTPRIFGYQESNNVASILVEFISGGTLDEVILTASEDILQNAMLLLEDIMIDIWELTLTQKAASITYMRQLISRMQDSQRLHPGLLRSGKHMGTIEIFSTGELIRKCTAFESSLQTPFTVLCHGDFNANNIVYDHSTQRIRYIDVYRSRQDDYVMDAAVFLMSNFRMPVFEPVLRERLNAVIYTFMKRVKAFAENHGDTTFHARMALALIRNFYTSIRFEHNHEFAREMALRSYYLMEKMIHHPPDNWNSFSFSEDILFY
jgi:phosphate uptake regulator